MRDTDWRPSKCPKCGEWREAAENPVCNCESENYTMNIKVNTTYTTSDGTVFHDESEAKEHEWNLRDRKLSAEFNITPEAARWITSSYEGKKLMKLHSLDEDGVWRVTGEDPNPDFGGHPHNPYIGTFKGKLKNVLEKAISSDKFFTWGAGERLKS